MSCVKLHGFIAKSLTKSHPCTPKAREISLKVERSKSAKYFWDVQIHRSDHTTGTALYSTPQDPHPRHAMAMLDLEFAVFPLPFAFWRGGVAAI